MSSDRTQNQSSEDQAKARELSIESTRPPAQVPGYKLQRFVGRGTYGEVWSATDLKTGRRVAIKFYLRGNRADVQLLAQEVEKLVVLSADRYVVQLLDVGWDADPPFYVMEYIEHGSLEERLRNGNTLPAVEAIDLFQEIANGMMHLHGKGILHCDLKPGNVLLDQDGKPRVADFGQSRLKTDQSAALGTLFYMAPEQADMTAIPDARWDVYALGALLFSMLTGKPPYYSKELSQEIESSEKIDSRLETYRAALLSADTPTEHRQIDGVDRSIADIVDRCIAVDPKKRFTNIQSVILALRQRELVKARRPLMLLGGLGPFLLILLGSLFGWWAFNQAITKSNEAVILKAEDSNDFAAKLAAKSAASRIDEYFRVVTRLAKKQSFLDAFDEVIANEELSAMRKSIANPKLNSRELLEPDKQTGSIRAKFQKNETRDYLQGFLQEKMDDPDNPNAASWFVSDRYGNQIASVFQDDVNKTLGNNYSYRTYFTGLDRDLDHDNPLINFKEADLGKRPIITSPHLSAVFKSQQSGHWKVAFSTPIVRYGNVEGIVAVTVDLGSFIEFEGSSSNHYAMLVDGRKGEFSGAILEHPLFKSVLQNQEVLPEDLTNTRVDVEQTSLEPRSFIDPIGETELGARSRYGRRAIANLVDITDLRAKPVVIDKQNQMSVDDNTSSLFVVMVNDYEEVMGDIGKLGTQLGRLLLFSTVLLLAVAIGMWMFVNRMMRESRERLARAFSPSDTSWVQERETMSSYAPSRTTNQQTEQLKPKI
jgi:serine/threonine protein kinase